MRFGAVILAAGTSARFGENKLLMPFGRSTVLETTISHFCRSDIDPIVVVTGAHAKSIGRRLKDGRVQLVINPLFGEGMSSSVRKGLESLPHGLDGAFICPGDLPAFHSRVVDRLVEAFQTGCPVVPVFHGRKGHPLLLDRAGVEEAITLFGDRILQRVLERRSHKIVYVEVDDEGILQDIDTREDYDRMAGGTAGGQ